MDGIFTAVGLSRVRAHIYMTMSNAILMDRLRLCAMYFPALALLAATHIANALAAPSSITTRDLLPSYDYIIVGGGAAGLTVADRLTEDAATTVLVLEAGDWGNADEVLSVNLAGGGSSIGDDSYFWPNLYSVPQVNLGNRIATILIGKIVGGGSAVNGMWNMRGAAEDYERWDQLFEGEGQNSSVRWGWEDILPFFKKVSCEFMASSWFGLNSVKSRIATRSSYLLGLSRDYILLHLQQS